MKRALMLGILLVTAVAGAADKDKEKDKENKQPKEVTVESLIADAEAKQAAGDLEGAQTALRDATKLPGASGEVWLRLGRLLEDQHDVDNAMDAYQSASAALAGAPKGEALGRLSLIQEMRGISEADATAEAALAADAAGAWPSVAASRAKTRAREFDAALALAEQAAAAGAGAAATVAKGFAQEGSGNLAAAEQAYSDVRTENPGDIAASVGLARVLRKSGRAAEAEPLLQQVLELAPGAIAAYKEAARVQLALNQPARAMEHAQLAAILAENDPEAQRLVTEVSIARAVAYVRTNQANLAVEELTALRDANPDLAEARIGLAQAMIAMRQVDAAIAELKQATQVSPELAVAHYDLGRALHVHKQNAGGALPEYEKAVALEPANLEYRTNLGAVLSELKQTERAVEELRRVVETPGYARPEAWIYLGGAYLNGRRYRDGAEALAKALEIVPDNAQAQAYAAWCAFGLKDAAAFKKHAGKARALGYQEATLMDYLKRVEAGEEIK